MQIDKYINPVALLRHIEDGYVRGVDHPTLSLSLLSYARKTVYENLWDDVTIRTRGLIYDNISGAVIARPFEKFFNADALFINSEDYDRPVFQDKLDGSLGIFWRYGGHWGIASKGSFTSPHATWMTGWMSQHIEEYGELVWPEGYTPLFEMIAESVQTHVLNYSGIEDLVLIALVKIETGEELNTLSLESYAKRNHLHTPAVYNMTLSASMALDREDHEGFVATYSRFDGKPPLKLKVKHPTFLKKQKLVHGVSPANTLKLLANEDHAALETLQMHLPQHILTRVRDWVECYVASYRYIHVTATVLMHEILKNLTTRKEAAEFLTKPENKPYAGICFLMLDQDEGAYQQAIWKLVGERVHIESTPMEEEN